MQNEIRKLDDEIIKLISAGEVIESPCSVVKELVENSIDSGATSIVVEIKNGGKSYIRVTDNGYGIDENFVQDAFKKHTTSKIVTFDDFINITTNGFRGEALASISAVAKISMTTKTKDKDYGINIVIQNDKILEKSKVGAKDGTTVIVEELLENVPARKKFLKSDRAETTKITDFLIRYAIANPHIKIKYISNSKQILSTYATGKIQDVINIIFNENYDKSVIELDEKLSKYLSVKGIIGNNSTMVSSRKMQYIFVNGRIIKDKHITEYIEKSYRKYIPSGNYPMFFVNIIIDPQRVDVNIHPNKLEVKFSDDIEIYKMIEDAIQKKLDTYDMIPNISLVKEDNNLESKIFDKVVSNYKEKEDNEKIFIEKQKDEDGNFYYNASIKTYTNEEEQEDDLEIEEIIEEVTKENETEEIKIENSIKPVYTIPKDIFEVTQVSDSKIKVVDLTLLKYCGRVFDTYIMLCDDEDMYMIDQHAAHERILYEKFLKEFYTDNISSQALIIPHNIGIPIKLVDYSITIIEYIGKFGFECDLFGDNIMLIRSIPIFLDIKGAINFINEVFDIFLNESLTSEIITDKIATKACKAAIKGNDTSIKEVEIESLLYDLENCENKYACPHGRPTITRISKYEVEKFFKRIL